MGRGPDRKRAGRWAYAIGFTAALGLTGPAVAADAQWVQLCSGHGTVWMLIVSNGDKAPSSDQMQGGCHSGCILPRKLRAPR